MAFSLLHFPLKFPLDEKEILLYPKKILFDRAKQGFFMRYFLCGGFFHLGKKIFVQNLNIGSLRTKGIGIDDAGALQLP